MDFKEIVEYLDTRDFGRYEKDEFDAFLEKVKFSFDLPAIHVAGSNGKGATLFYLRNIYREAGYHVATYHSPYFYDVREMTEVDGEMISVEDFTRLFNENEALFKKYDLTAFEMETYIAFRYFLEKKPDICIIECGMGGEIDATNVFDPILAIITSVSLEHTGYLGRTLSEIALSKAGIMRPGRPVLTGVIPETARTVIADVAARYDSHFRQVSDYHFPIYNDGIMTFALESHEGLKLKTDAVYQMRNASLAVTAIDMLKNDFPVSEEAIKAGLLKEEPILHLERIGHIYFDGAHNPEAMEILNESIEILFKDIPVHVLFASFRDKNINAELPLLGTYVKDITLTTFDHKRARTEEDYFLYLEDYPFKEDYKAALSELMATYPNDIILVTGSLAFASAVRKHVLENKK